MRWKLLLPMWAQRWIISISQIRNWPLHWYHDLLKGAQAWSHLALWVMIWSPIAWIAFVSAFTHPTLVFRDETSIIPSLFRFSVLINFKFQLWWQTEQAEMIPVNFGFSLTGHVPGTKLLHPIFPPYFKYSPPYIVRGSWQSRWRSHLSPPRSSGWPRGSWKTVAPESRNKRRLKEGENNLGWV